MKTPDSTASKVSALALSGLAIGWLMGLSVSPNVQNVIASFIALIVSIMSVIAGVSMVKKMVDLADQKPEGEVKSKAKKEQENTSLESSRTIAIASLWPMAGLMAGLMAGSTLGLVVRNNNLLGIYPSLVAWRWGVDKNKLNKDALLTLVTNDLSDTSRGVFSSFLYVGEMSLCNSEGEVLRAGLLNMTSDKTYQIMIENATDSTLIKIRDENCNK